MSCTPSGKPSLKTGERYLPAAAWKSLTPAERAATNAAKRKGMRAGKQFVKQPAAIAKKTARVQMHIFNEAGHFSYRERPDEFNRVIAEFIEGVNHGE